MNAHEIKNSDVAEFSAFTGGSVTISPEADAVKAIRPNLHDVLADAESLNDEIEHLRGVAWRALQREAEAVKRCERMALNAIPSTEISVKWEELRQKLNNSVKRCEKLECALRWIVQRGSDPESIVAEMALERWP